MWYFSSELDLLDDPYRCEFPAFPSCRPPGAVSQFEIGLLDAQTRQAEYLHQH